MPHASSHAGNSASAPCMIPCDWAWTNPLQTLTANWEENIIKTLCLISKQSPIFTFSKVTPSTFGLLSLQLVVRPGIENLPMVSLRLQNITTASLGQPTLTNECLIFQSSRHTLQLHTDYTEKCSANIYNNFYYYYYNDNKLLQKHPLNLGKSAVRRHGRRLLRNTTQTTN